MDVCHTSMVASSTYNDIVAIAHMLCVAAATSIMSSRSSDVAKTEPAVMPNVATTSLEYTPSMPIVRASL